MCFSQHFDRKTNFPPYKYGWSISLPINSKTENKAQNLKLCLPPNWNGSVFLSESWAINIALCGLSLKHRCIIFTIFFGCIPCPMKYQFLAFTYCTFGNILFSCSYTIRSIVFQLMWNCILLDWFCAHTIQYFLSSNQFCLVL